MSQPLPSLSDDDLAVPPELLNAMRNESGEWTPNCPDPDAIIRLLEHGGKNWAAQRVLSHMANCAYCRHQFRLYRQAMLQSGKISAGYVPNSGELLQGAGIGHRRSPLRLSSQYGVALMAAGILIGMLVPSLYFSRRKEDIDARLARIMLRTNNRFALEMEEKDKEIQKIKETLQKNNDLIATLRIQKNAASKQATAANTQNKKLEEKYLKAQIALEQKTRPQTYRMDAQLLNALHGENTAGGNGETTRPMVVVFPPPASLTTDRQPTFEWKPVSGATTYRVTAFNFSHPDSTKLLSPAVKQTRWRASVPLKPGSVYEWSVTAWNAQDQLVATATARFAVLPATP